jgi:hypothetical protein
VSAYVDRLYAGGFLNDDSHRLTRLGFRCAALLMVFSAPIYIPRREVTVAIDAIQNLSCRSATQVLQKRHKRRESKSDSAGAILGPPRIFGICAECLRGGVSAIFRGAATAVDPRGVGTKGSVGRSFAKTLSFALNFCFGHGFSFASSLFSHIRAIVHSVTSDAGRFSRAFTSFSHVNLRERSG